MNQPERKFFGLNPKTWAIITLIIGISTFTILVLVPYIIAILLPIINGTYDQLISLTDGIALTVGIVGTIASVLSIVMTEKDKKRYTQEKEQMQDLVTSVKSLREDVSGIAANVDKTFQQNTRLGAALFKKNVIDINPNLIDISVNDSANSSPTWNEGKKSGERPLSAEGK